LILEAECYEEVSHVESLRIHISQSIEREEELPFSPIARVRENLKTESDV
jgi:hypothetical protein